MRRLSRCILSLAAAVCAFATTEASGQNTILRFEHTSAKPQEFSVTPAKGGKDFVVSDGQEVELFETAKLCVQVTKANPLYYQYALTRKELELQLPSGLTDFLAAFGKLKASIPGGRLALLVFTDSAPYEKLLTRADNALNSVQDFKRASLTKGFAAMHVLAQDSLRVAETALAEARKLVEAATGTRDRDDPVRVLALEALEQQLAQSKKEWKTANTRYEQLASPGECVNGGPKDLQLGFHIKSIVESPGRVKEHLVTSDENELYTGPVFENITGDVVSRQLIVGAVGVLLGFFTGVDTFTVNNGVVQQGEKSENPLRPAAFLYARPSWQWPLWMTLGIGTGEKITNPDFFLGISARIGGNASTPLVTIGAGAMWSAFPTQLGNGAQVGHPLPDEIKNLSEAVTLDRRWGFGLHLTIFGFDLVAGKTTGKKEEK